MTDLFKKYEEATSEDTTVAIFLQELDCGTTPSTLQAGGMLLSHLSQKSSSKRS